VVRVPGYRSRDPGFDSWSYQISGVVVGLEQGPLSLVRVTAELLEWKSSSSGSIKSRLMAVGIRCTDHTAPSIRNKLALTSPTSGGRSVVIVRLRTKATEFSFLFNSLWTNLTLNEMIRELNTDENIRKLTCRNKMNCGNLCTGFTISPKKDKRSCALICFTCNEKPHQ
jgi:hypothetical protein